MSSGACGDASRTERTRRKSVTSCKTSKERQNCHLYVPCNCYITYRGRSILASLCTLYLVECHLVVCADSMHCSWSRSLHQADFRVERDPQSHKLLPDLVTRVNAFLCLENRVWLYLSTVLDEGSGAGLMRRGPRDDPGAVLGSPARHVEHPESTQTGSAM